MGGLNELEYINFQTVEQINIAALCLSSYSWIETIHIFCLLFLLLIMVGVHNYLTHSIH